jgi:hypothetical protein
MLKAIPSEMLSIVEWMAAGDAFDARGRMSMNEGRTFDGSIPKSVVAKRNEKKRV